MRHSIMKRGKEASVSDRQHATTEDIRRWERQHLEGGQSIAARRLQKAADTIEALQQRCEEAENHYSSVSADLDLAEERIAAAKQDGRQGGFAEAREMAADLAGYRNCQKCGASQVSFADAIRALQPPRDEGKREGGDG